MCVLDNLMKGIMYVAILVSFSEELLLSYIIVDRVGIVTQFDFNSVLSFRNTGRLSHFTCNAGNLLPCLVL